MSLKNKLSTPALQGLIRNALKEDIGSGDITSKILIPENKPVKAVIIFKEEATVAGLEVAREVFKALDREIRFEAVSVDGSQVKPGKIIAKIQGRAGSILSGERTALNFLSHLSGIATLTRSFVDEVKPYKARIMDTRKTIPGLRELEKYAVALGGGCNHRIGLWDAILVKDNHLAALKSGSGGISVKDIARLVKEKKPRGMKSDIEVRNLKEFREALEFPPDIIMLDNMDMGRIKKAVAIRDAKCNRQNVKIEVSGGVRLSNVRAIARAGVDMISIGALTHSAKAVDISLEVETVEVGVSPCPG